MIKLIKGIINGKSLNNKYNGDWGLEVLCLQSADGEQDDGQNQ